MTPGQQIRRYRMAAGLTSAELAARAGMSRGYLSVLENGIRDSPSAKILSRVAAVLGVSVQDLLDEQPPPVRCKHWAIQWATAPGGAIECQSCGHTWEIQP
jgi:transcriptional regulator with XRE-family HTH domain